MPWSLRAQASGTRQPRQRTDADRQRDAQRASTTARGYGGQWPTIRRKAILRAGKRCSLCGESGYLVVHHINHDPSDNSAENLQVMCRQHHEALHGRGKG